MPYKAISDPPILLVDDEPQLLHSASIVLRATGMPEVLTLQDSREVLHMLANREIGVLVLDLSMPHLSGKHVLENVAVDFPEVPVIVMTANNDLETAVQCMQIGASDYLVKPVDKNRLVASVRRALEMRAMRKELFWFFGNSHGWQLIVN